MALIDDKEKLREYKAAHYINNIDKYRESNRSSRRKYHKKMMETNVLYRLKQGFQRRLYKSLKRGKFGKHTTMNISEIMGCSFDEFKLHLESQFEPWMNWDNYGKYNGEINHGWDIDHFIPLSSAKTIEEFFKLNHYSNLKPLCGYTNRCIKKSKLF